MERATLDEQERERQRAGIAWALADLDSLLDRGVIARASYDALRGDYERRLYWLQVPAASPVPPLPVEAASAPISVVPNPAPETPPIAAPQAEPHPVVEPSPIPAHQPAAAVANAASSVSDVAPGTPPMAATVPGGAPRPAGVTDLWVNLTLFLGAFFIVIAALILVGTQWGAISAGVKAAIMAGFTFGFIGVGLVCLRLPRVRPAGQTFLAIGAILLPLDIVGAYSLILSDRGLSGTVTWALGSVICALFYAALAARGVGRAYAVGAIVATISAWGGTLAAFDVPGIWAAAAFMPLPLALLLLGRLAERTSFGRATFGPLPAWAAQLLIPVALLIAMTNGFADNAARGVAVAFALIALFYAGAALSQSKVLPRTLHVAAAWGAIGAFALAVGWWADIAPRGYAAILLGVAWLALAVTVGLRYAGEPWRVPANVSLGAGWIAGGLLLLPWGYFARDNHLYWSLIFGGMLCFVALNLWGFRQPLTVYPLALAIAVTLFHLLAIGPQPEGYGYAWAYLLASLIPVGLLQPLRQSGASRSWDRHLVVSGQLYAIGAAIVSWTVGDPFQLAAILLVGVLASLFVTALERRHELLILPNLWGLCATAAILRLAGSGPRWAPACYAGVGLFLAIGLQAWRPIPAARRDGWFFAHRFSAGGWAIIGPLLALAFLAAPLADALAAGELVRLVLAHGYGPAGLAVALCGAALAADAIMTLRRPTGYSASAMIALAILMGIARISPDNPQAYAIPLGLYLLALSVYVAYERDLGPMRMPSANALLAAAIVVILGTTFLQSLGQPWRYIALGLIEGLALLGATAFLRRRYGVALSVAFIVLIAFRAVFDVARALPNWALIGLLGLLLLGAGVLFLLRRDRLEAWASGTLRRWSELT